MSTPQPEGQRVNKAPVPNDARNAQNAANQQNTQRSQGPQNSQNQQQNPQNAQNSQKSGPARSKVQNQDAPMKRASAKPQTKFEKVRRARLTVSQMNIGSVVKIALLLSVAMLIMTVIAGIVLLLLMNVTGIMAQINDFAKQVAGEDSKFDIHQIFSVGHVVAISALIGVINVFLFTAFAAVTAFIYNLSANMVGGVGVTLTDD